ncbi:hypothetical protein RYX36_024942 [Vicia faba]
MDPNGIEWKDDTTAKELELECFFPVFSMVTATFFEMKILRVARVHGLIDMPDVTIPMSIWWLIPQYVLFGVSDVFTMRLPLFSIEANRCERTFVLSTTGQKNSVYDKPLDLRKYDFTNEKSNLKRKNMSTTLMSDVKFDGPDLTTVVMSKAYAVGGSFKGVDFSNAVLNRVNFGKAEL